MYKQSDLIYMKHRKGRAVYFCLFLSDTYYVFLKQDNLYVGYSYYNKDIIGDFKNFYNIFKL